MEQQPLIDIRALQKSYVTGDVETPVLHGIDLTLNAGEFVAIMGPSGSGKSTLMHILGFLDTASSGTYLFQGRDVSNVSDDELADVRSRQVSFVFQAFNLLPRTTVLENVALPLMYQSHISKEDRVQKAEEAIEAVGLTDRTLHKSNQLSGGQQQRVAIARALVTNPQIIFADEPTGNLDSKSGLQVMQILDRLHREGHTIVLVTHEQATAEHAERIIHMVDGKIDSDSKAFKRRLLHGFNASLLPSTRSIC